MHTAPEPPNVANPCFWFPYQLFHHFILHVSWCPVQVRTFARTWKVLPVMSMRSQPILLRLLTTQFSNTDFLSCRYLPSMLGGGRNTITSTGIIISPFIIINLRKKKRKIKSLGLKTAAPHANNVTWELHHQLPECQPPSENVHQHLPKSMS